MGLFLNLFLGVLSGVIVAIGAIWIRKIFTPWLEDRLYKGVVIAGKWSGDKKHQACLCKDCAEKKGVPVGTHIVTSSLETTLELKQNGYHITGLFSAKTISYEDGKPTSDEYENLYTLNGRVNDNYVVMQYQPVSRSRTGLGAFVLRVKDGGKSLEGSVSFVEETEMDIATIKDIRLTRVDK